MKRRSKKLFIEACEKRGLKTVTRSQIGSICEQESLAMPQWLLTDNQHRVKWGVYRVPTLSEVNPNFELESNVNNYLAPVSDTTKSADQVETKTLNPDKSIICQVPDVDPLFVPHGNYDDIETIISAGIFHPFFVTGPTGSGKTFEIQQACAKLGRATVRVNMTSMTDEDKLIGGFRLLAGETVFFHGPVVVAMQEGALLLLDEFDLADPEKTMCLQPILEGKGYYIKDTGEYIEPQPGFNIAATSNTKGRGSDTGEYIGTQILNEAYLDRFTNAFEQGYPKKPVERKILQLAAKFHLDTQTLDGEPAGFIETLLKWAANVRKLYAEGDTFTSPMSTRRLVQIIQTYAMFKSKAKAIELCTSRYDDIQKTALVEFFEKSDGEPQLDLKEEMGEVEDETAEEDAAW